MKKLISPRFVSSSISSGDDYNDLSLLAMIRRIPWLVILLTLLLGLTGVAALYSAADGNLFPWAAKHLVRLGLGFGLMLLVAILPLGLIRRYAFLWWLGAVGLLGLLGVFGSGQGVTRWFSVGGFNFQPSEPTKLAVIVLLAAYFHSIYPELLRYVRTYVVPALIVLIPFGLVLVQPDLGTSSMLLITAAVVVYVAGMPRWMIVTLFGLLILSIPALWVFLYQYQRDRILVFLNPELDSLGAGYQITQSKIALGSGGLFGKGYLQGSQSHLDFLPEHQTDFIFTMIGEEFGLLGCLFVLGLYSGLVISLFWYSYSLKYQFSRLLTIGVAAMIGIYVIINVSMVSGMLPVVGAPLPLISYGGTAMMTVFIGLGLFINAVMNDKEHDK